MTKSCIVKTSDCLDTGNHGFENTVNIKLNQMQKSIIKKKCLSQGNYQPNRMSTRSDHSTFTLFTRRRISSRISLLVKQTLTRKRDLLKYLMEYKLQAKMFDERP